MALHRITSITIGVPDVGATARYYEEFGLATSNGIDFSTVDGGHQLTLVHAPRRSLEELGVGVDSADDLDRIASQLTRLGHDSVRDGLVLRTFEPVAGSR